MIHKLHWKFYFTFLPCHHTLNLITISFTINCQTDTIFISRCLLFTDLSKYFYISISISLDRRSYSFIIFLQPYPYHHRTVPACYLPQLASNASLETFLTLVRDADTAEAAHMHVSIFLFPADSPHHCIHQTLIVPHSTTLCFTQTHSLFSIFQSPIYSLFLFSVFSLIPLFYFTLSHSNTLCLHFTSFYLTLTHSIFILSHPNTQMHSV